MSIPCRNIGEMMPSGLHEGELRALFDDSPRAVGLLASAPGERSFDSAHLRHGIWRHHLIEAFTGKVRAGVTTDGALTAATLQAYLADAVPRTLRRSYETPQEQSPVLLGEAHARDGACGPGVSPRNGRRNPRPRTHEARRVPLGEHRQGQGSRGLPQVALASRPSQRLVRKYVNRIAAADIKADLDRTFDMVRDEFGYKRKDLDVSAERDGMGFIRTPEFEYTISLEVNPTSRPRSSGGARSAGWRARVRPVAAVPGGVRLDVRPPRLRVRCAGERRRVRGPHRGSASRGREGRAWPATPMPPRSRSRASRGKVMVRPDSVTIHGRAGAPANLLEQFLTFLRKFAGLGEPKALLPTS